MLNVNTTDHIFYFIDIAISIIHVYTHIYFIVQFQWWAQLLRQIVYILHKHYNIEILVNRPFHYISEIRGAPIDYIYYTPLFLQN